MKKLFKLILFGMLISAFLTGCSFGGTKKDVTIASKMFTENILLSEIYAQLIENRTDIEVTRKQSLGGTSVCYAEMENGNVDIYVEYTGTIYNEILKMESDPNMTSDELYNIVKKEMNDTRNVTVYQPIGLNNTFALAMQTEKAEALGLKTVSDLSSAASKLIFAANSLYYPRLNDGYDALSEKYDINFKSTVKMDYALLYDAAEQGQADVIIVYATDSLLKKHDMIILEDDKQIFSAYYGVPMIRNEILKKYPELGGVLDLLAERIDNERMQELNYLIDVENKQPEEVAKAFLTEEGLLK